MDYEIMMNNNLKIGMEAPDFDAVSTMGDISLSSYKGKWIVFFHTQTIFHLSAQPR